MINFYRDVFKRRSHILATLNDLAAVTAKQQTRKKKKKIAKFRMLKEYIDEFLESQRKD